MKLGGWVLTEIRGLDLAAMPFVPLSLASFLNEAQIWLVL